jgi:hypothetical protein
MANTISMESYEALAARVTKLEEALAKSRGTASTREMTDDDARRVMTGDLASASHKAAAETLGLSYGQIYSARGGYTFKHVAKEVGFKAPTK